MGLVDDALSGNRRALARLATHLENDDDLARDAFERLYPRSGRAQTIGVTGPPGAGKSTLVARLIEALRSADRTVAVVAVDPSSPLTGGAALGDRIRMLDLQADPGVFIRSMASRGRTGGLAHTTSALVHLFDAVGFDVVIVETVGIGQEEIDVAGCVDSVLLVQVPGLGDSIQSLKAGVLEIADVYAVNKADLPGADATARELKALLTLAPSSGGWAPPVISVSAKDATGIDALVDRLDRHRSWLQESEHLTDRRTAIAEREISRHVQRLLAEHLGLERRDDRIAAIVEHVASREETPRAAAEQILRDWSAVR